MLILLHGAAKYKPELEFFCLHAQVELAQVEKVSKNDESLREKLHQLHVPTELVRKNAMAHEEAEPGDSDAEIVRVFGGTCPYDVFPCLQP
jgi:hypothetical protein